MNATVPKVYQAITNVTLALSKHGIAKGRKNQTQGYSFRGIDDIYNALASELAANKLCILPVVLERTCEERPSKNGGVLFYVNIQMRLDFVSAEDGSRHEVVTLGEAMDSGDKATNKAMSAAFKYACLMAFCIPTEGDNDTENQTHEVASKPAPPPAAPPAKSAAHPFSGDARAIPIVAKQDGKPDWIAWGGVVIATLKACKTADKVEAWMNANAAPLGVCATAAPKAHGSITRCAVAWAATLPKEPEPEFMTAADAGAARLAGG